MATPGLCLPPYQRDHAAGPGILYVFQVEITYGYNWPIESWMKPAPVDYAFDASAAAAERAEAEAEAESDFDTSLEGA